MFYVMNILCTFRISVYGYGTPIFKKNKEAILMKGYSMHNCLNDRL